MQDGIDPKWPIRPPRPRVLALALATLLSGVLMAGCGGAGSSSTQTSLPSRTAATSSAATSSDSALPAAVNPGVAFARCMRASGVPGFPDPQPGRGLLFSMNGLDPSSPAFRAAQMKCHRLLPGGGPPGPGSTTRPSAQTLAKLVRIARCMRQHGVPDFPDPRTSVPLDPFPSSGGVITDYDGAILLFPSTLNMESPAYAQATAACGTLAEKLGRGPHG
ncbi:MAG: hypothetical protein JO130_17675 [Solirubrobacterales bacterium]|nr:hypothetical protein [Solirubrobacterales bacterium]